MPSMTAPTALASNLGTQIAAKTTALPCSILTFPLLPPVLKIYIYGLLADVLIHCIDGERFASIKKHLSKKNTAAKSFSVSPSVATSCPLQFLFFSSHHQESLPHHR